MIGLYNLTYLFSTLLLLVSFLRLESIFLYMSIVGSLFLINNYSFVKKIFSFTCYLVDLVLLSHLIIFFLRLVGINSLPLIGNLPLIGWDKVDDFGIPLTSSRELIFTNLELQRVPGLFGNIHLTSLVFIISFLFWRNRELFVSWRKSKLNPNRLLHINIFQIISFASVLALFLSQNYQYIVLFLLFLFFKRNQKVYFNFIESLLNLRIKKLVNNIFNLNFFLKLTFATLILILLDSLAQTLYLTKLIPILIGTAQEGINNVFSELNNLSDNNLLITLLFGSRDFEANIHDVDLYIPLLEEIQLITYFFRYGFLGLFVLFAWLILMFEKSKSNSVRIFLSLLPLTFIHYCNLASPYIIVLLTFLVADKNKLSKKEV